MLRLSLFLHAETCWACAQEGALSISLQFSAYLWRRQSRWRQKEWMRLVIMSLKHNTAGRRQRRAGLRRIGQVLMNIYKDENAVMTWLERSERMQQEQERKRGVARRCIRRQLWLILRTKRGALDALKDEVSVGPVERWVDAVHEGKGTRVEERLRHAMRCLIVYVREVTRPTEKRGRERRAEAERKRHAKWMVCAVLVRIYKQQKQKEVLQQRAESRVGLVCASTRNVGRLGPKGGIKYDETKRHKAHIKDTEVYRAHRWPRRDKCGAALVDMLHHVWDVT